jgi:hypothetical protein
MTKPVVRDALRPEELSSGSAQTLVLENKDAIGPEDPRDFMQRLRE